MGPLSSSFCKFLKTLPLSLMPLFIKKIPIAPRGGERIWTLESGKRVGVGKAQFSARTNERTNEHIYDPNQYCRAVVLRTHSLRTRIKPFLRGRVSGAGSHFGCD